MVKSEQAVTVDFTTADPTTGAAADADSTPVATLVVNGTDDAAAVTVTNKATGVYKAAVTLPTLGAGDVVSIRVAATVATVAGVGVVWTDVVDTKRVSDLKDEAMRGTDDALLADDYTAPPSASDIATAVWGATTRTLSSFGTLVADAATAVWGAVTRSLTDKTGFALTAAYDHAKDDVLTPLAVVDANVDSILDDTSTSIPTSIAELPTDADVQTAARAALDDYAPTTWRDIPTDAEIQAAAQAAIVTEGVSKFDAASDTVRVGNIDDIDAALSAAHGSGSWGETVEDGVTIDPTTLGTDGLPIERVMPYGKITVYLNGVAQDSFDADADGDFSFKLPKGSVWTLIASNPPLYRSTSVDVSTIPVVE